MMGQSNVRPSGSSHYLPVGMQYDSVMTVSFSIMKDPCKYDDLDMDFELVNQLYQWLNRKTYYEFRPIYEDASIPDEIYYLGTFNLSLEQAGGKTIGLNLTFTADGPNGYQNVEAEGTTNASTGLTLINPSSDYGYDNISAFVLITKEAGTLTITNSNDEATTVIKNCKENEYIFFYGIYKEIFAFGHEGNIMSDFNYRFPRMVNTHTSNVNTFTTSLSCDVEIFHMAVKKVVLL
jgi:hypothetical protein